MSEKKILNTVTEILRSNNNLGIYTYYLSNCINSLIAQISSVVQKIGGINIKENELFFKQTGLEDVQFFIDSNGNLIIKSNQGKDFFLNDEGELVMIEYDPICGGEVLEGNFLSTEEGLFITEEDNVGSLLIEE